MTSPTSEQESAGDSTRPSASTFAIHNKAMAHKPDMEAVLRAELSDLRLQKTGLEAMLCDANGVISDLREKGRENIRLGRENAELRARIKALEEMGRPFAEAKRKADGVGEPWFTRHGLAWQDFIRAAELIP